MRSMRKPKGKWAKAAVAGFALAALAAAAVALTSYVSPWAFLHAAQKAWERKDGAAVSAMVDWQSVQDGATRRMAYELLTAAGIRAGDERVPGIILSVQEAMGKVVVPENLNTVIAESKWDADKLIIRGAYMDVGHFIFAVESKEGKSAVSIRLRRKGPWSWVIDDVESLDVSKLAGRG